MIFFKKAVSPVVATALLLVVAVSAVVGFSNWISEFNSNLFVDVDSDSSSSSSVRVEGIFNDVLYLKSNSKTDLSLLSIIDSDGVEACSFSGTSEVSNDGLVGHWDFSNTGDGIIHDLSGNGNDGKLYGDTRLLLDFDDGTVTDRTSYDNSGVVNGATWTSGDCVSGGCYEFDGVDDYINISYDDSLNLTGIFSVSAWIKSRTYDQQVIFRKSSFNDIGGFFLEIYGSENKSRFVVKYNSSNLTYVESNFNLNEYIHLVGTYDLNTINLYLNGDLVDSVALSYPVIDDNNFNMAIGALLRDRAAPVGQRFNGFIDEVSIYSKALSSVEVLELYNSQKADFVEFSHDGLEFDGIDDYVEVSSITNFLENNYTIFSSTKNYNSVSGVLFASNKLDYSNNWFTVIQGSNFVFDMLGGFNEIITPIKKKNNFITLTKNGSNMSIYFDGEFINSALSLVNISASDFFFFGQEYDGIEVMTDFFKGEMNEIKIYDRSLFDFEIKILSTQDLSLNSNNLNKIDLSSCNLSKSSKYSIVGFTDSSKINVEVIPQ